MQSPASPTMEAILQLYDYISFFLLVIFIFVFWFFFNILIDFNETTSAVTPAEIAQQAISYKHTSRIVHLGTLEVIWTIIPVLILTAIAVPSFELLYALDMVTNPLLTIKCIGNQWYWAYEGIYHHQFDREQIKREADELFELNRDYYNKRLAPWWRKLKKGYRSAWTIGDLYFNPYKRVKSRGKAIAGVLSLADNVKRNWFMSMSKRTFIHVKFFGDRYNLDIDMPFDFAGDSFMLDADELVMGTYRLLETDGFLSLPCNAEIRFVVTASDVLHSFAIPALGVKLDAIPGRLNQFGMKVRVPGVYFGQCSELCGVGHGFMPIKVKFVANWLHML